MNPPADNSGPRGHEPKTGRIGARSGRWLAWGTAIAVVAYACSGIVTVGTDERGVLQRFGRVRGEPLRPGVHMVLPVGIDRVTPIRLHRTRRVTVGAVPGERVVGNLPAPEQSQFLSGDRNIVDIRAAAQFVVEDPVAYLFRTASSDTLVRDTVEAALSGVMAAMNVDDVLTRRKADIQNAVRTKAQALLRRYGAGVALLSVSIERATPPEAVADAFRDVVSARADSRRRQAQAQGYRDDLLARTTGEAAAMRKAGDADAYAVVERARGRAQRFAAVLSEARKQPELTRRRLWAQTVEKLLPRTRLIVADPHAETDVRLVEEAR